MQWRVWMYSIKKLTTPKELFTHIFVAALVGLALNACSSITNQLPGTRSPIKTPEFQSTIQNLSNYPIPLTDASAAYPSPQPTATSVPYPAGSSQKPTPYFTPTPVVQWNADAIEVYWDGYSAVGQPEWLSNTVAKLAVYPAGFNDGLITVDISIGKEARASKVVVHSGWRIFSSQETYVIECTNGMQMYRVDGHQVVSETTFLPRHFPSVDCSIYTNWAPDESAASFMSDAGDFYVWRSDGAQPKKIMEQALSPGSWAPDSSKLAIEKSETSSRIATVDVVDRSGQLLHELQVQAGGDGYARLGWLTADVLASYSRYTIWYYDIASGNFLFSWTSMPNGDGAVHQSPQVSPDGRWVFIDQGNEFRQSAVETYRNIVHKKYSLYNIRSQTSIALLDDWGNYLLYAGWSADASTLYLISRPAESVSISNPATPFGLLGYNVNTHQFEVLFKEAVQVVWNADKSWAFVVFPVQNETGQLQLAGGLWKFGSATLIGRWPVSDQMVYQDPAGDAFFPAFPGPVPIAWSHDGRSVAVSDRSGRVRLVGVDGSEIPLTEDQWIDDQPRVSIALRWSPDDRHLLVSTRNRAWIMDTSYP